MRIQAVITVIYNAGDFTFQSPEMMTINITLLLKIIPQKILLFVTPNAYSQLSFAIFFSTFARITRSDVGQ